MTNKKYTYDEVFEASKTYFNGDELAAKVFVDKYALQNKSGEYLELTPTDMHWRLAKEFARIEQKYPNPMSEQEIFDLLDQFKYVIPQGSPMFGIGNDHFVQSLGNCFVVPSPLDSYGSILQADQQLAQLMKRRSGVGIDISNIRPKGLATNNAAKTTDGIGIFMERYSNTTREVAQNSRRGALMISISNKHPEVERFIEIKQDKNKVTGANVSVRILDDFMKAVKENKEYELQWPVDSKSPSVRKTILAKELWDKLIDANWNSAEPGVMFWDTMIKNSPADIYAEKYPNFKTQSSNPCSELPLGNDSCRLLVINLASYVINPFTKNAFFDYDLYAKHAIMAQRLMDDLVDLEIEKINKIISKIESDPEPDSVKFVELDLWKTFLQSAIQGRRTGTGITALGDTMAFLGIKYGSKESIELTEKIYQTLEVNVYKSTCIMAQERGAFPIYDYELEKNHVFVGKIVKQDKELYDLYKKHGRRNIALTTTAPTGSVSTMTQTTSGIEPAFLLSYVRRKKINPSDKNAQIDFVDDMGDKWQEFVVYHHGVKKWMDVTGETDIEKSPYYGATSAEIDWMASVDIQAAAQKWICHSISKTCNLPNSATRELISDVYMKAYDSGCKGFTVYRDGCRTGVLISTKNKTDQSGRPKEIQSVMAPKRPEKLPCEIHYAKVKGKNWVVLVGLLDGKPYEIFSGESEAISLPSKCTTGSLQKSAKGKYNLHVLIGDEEMIIKDVVKVFDNSENSWATRLVSMSMRHGVPLDMVIDQLNKDGDVFAVNKIIGRILKKYIVEGSKVRVSAKCPECSSTELYYIEGCMTCKNCSWSKCN